MGLEEAKRAVAGAVDRAAPRLVEVSRTMYENPELGHREFKASALLAGFLEEAGFRVTRNVAGLETAFLAVWPPDGGGLKTGPTVAVLAEYDALPKVGHGCGHNIIGSAAAGAGLALASLGALPGRVLVIGCPAEEGGADGAGGKVFLLEAGVFDGVDAALMVHPGSVDAVSSPSACRVALEMTFRGRAAHAAGSPHEGVNALEAVLQTFNGINALRQHLPESVLVHGVVVKGGEAPNIVPDEGVVRLYVRAPVRAELEPAAERVKDCARGAALATGCEVRFREFSRTYLDLVPNRALDELFARNMTALGRPPVRTRRAGGRVGSTDMGNVSHVVPAIHPYVAVTGGRPVPSHSREFAEATVSPDGEAALIVGAKALAMTCLDLLLSPESLREVKDSAGRGDQPGRG